MQLLSWFPPKSCFLSRADPRWQRNLELSLKHLNQIVYGDNFCFEKIYLHWKQTLNTPSHFLLLNGKKNGFTANDWQGKTIFGYFLVKSVFHFSKPGPIKHV